MSDGKSLKFELVVGADGLVEGLKVASKGVDGVSQEIQRSLKGVGDAAHAGATPLSGFTDYVKDYVSEERQQGRMGSFLAKQIGQVGILSKESAGGIGQMIGAFSFGGGIGLAIESVKVLFEWIHKSGEEAEKQSEALKKSYRDTSKSIKTAFEELQNEFDKDKRTKTEQAWHKEVEKGKEKIAELDEQIGKLLKQAGSMGQFVSYLGSVFANGPEHAKIAIEQEIAKLHAQQDAIVKAIEDGRPKRDETAKAEARHEAEERHRDEENAEIEHEQRLLALKAKALQGEAKIRAEAAAQIATIQANEKSTAEQDAEEIAQVEKNTAAEIDKLHVETAKKEREHAQAHEQELLTIKSERLDGEAQIHLKAFAQIKKIDDDETKSAQEKAELQIEIKKNEADSIAKYRKQLRDKDAAEEQRTAQQVASVVERTFGGALKSIVNGSKSVADAVRDMFVGIGEAIIDTAVKMGVQALATAVLTKGANISNTQGNIATAASGAAASVAAIPLVGPALAASAAAETTAMLEGITAPLLSARGGFDIPAGVNPLVQTHEREMILPAKYADVIRGMAEGGGAGSGDVHLHVHATDADSVRNWFAKPSTQTGLADALRDMKRRNRF